MEKTRHYSSLMLLPALLVCGGLAKADLCSTEANYAALEATGTTGCTIGDKTYNDFTFQPSATGGAAALTASDVTFTTVDNGLIANGFDFSFSLDATANPDGTSQSNDVLIGFNVSITTPGTNLIASSNLVMNGAFIGTGIASIAETDCIGAPVAGCAAGNTVALTTSNSSFGSVPADGISFGGVNELGVSKDINVSSGTAGFASISGVNETVDQVLIPTPEPASIVFFGTMLLGVTALIRKKQVKRS
jgi:hypothetical protein